MSFLFPNLPKKNLVAKLTISQRPQKLDVDDAPQHSY